jgi:glucose/mannose transport system substrate-binding protein
VTRASITRSRSRELDPLELLEGLLLAELGPERFEALWTAKADWSEVGVTRVLDDYSRPLSYSNPDRDNLH